MRPHPHRVHFVQSLVFDPGLDHIFGEHIAFEQEFMVLFKGLQGFIQRSWCRRNLGQFFRRQGIDVFIQGLSRMNAILDPVEGCHEEGAEGHVAIA